MPDDNVAYEPDLRRIPALTERLRAEGVLLAGDVDEDLVQTIRSLVPDLRQTSDRFALRAARGMNPGVYATRVRSRWTLLIVPGSPAPGTSSRSDSVTKIDDDDDDLVVAYEFTTQYWQSATPVSDERVWPTGTHVRLVGGNEFGRVVGHRRVADSVRYTVEFQGVRTDVSASQLEELPGDMSDPHVWITLPPAGADQIARTVAWTKLRHPLTDVLYSFQASRTLFRPYQFKPVLKMIQGEDHRLLIADEVGLGKTIEAGLIWAELEGRNPLDRVLVVCPSSLTVKWQTEMERRFDRKLELLRSEDWEDFFARLARGDNAPLLGVDSIERLRMTNVPDRLITSGIRFDLIVVDEAHKMRNPGRRTHDLGQALADAADAFVMLTATPVNLGNEDLFNLLALLDEGRFSDRDLFLLESQPNAHINRAASKLLDPRARPRHVRGELLNLASHRVGSAILGRPDAKQLLTLLDTDERLSAADISRVKRTLAGLGTFASYITRTRKVDVPEAKAKREAVTLKVAWSPAEQAFYDQVRRWAAERAESLGTPPGFAEQMPLRQTASCIPAMARRLAIPHGGALEVDYLAEGDAVSDGAEATRSGLALTAPPTDSKFDALLTALRAIRGAGLHQVMVFSYFQYTLAYLAERLSRSGYTVRVMHGKVPLDERQRIMDAFRAGQFQILLISEVGSEGLDFEYCGALVNYDLPWNPMRVEQRIGRLDRFGQKHEKILIYNFTVEGTIEDRILMRLYERIGVFRDSIGDLEPILADEIESVKGLLADARLTDAEREERARRIEIALAEKEHQIEQLRENEGSLTQLDHVLIDGFEADNPGGGRFIGSRELAILLQDLATRTGGALTLIDSHDVVRLTGTPALAAKLREHLRREAAPNPGRMIQDFQDSQALTLALNPAAAERGHPLVHVRHPLVRLAVDEIRADGLALHRYGHISLRDRPESQYLAVLSLNEGRGLRSFLRLEATVVDDGGVECPDISTELLQAFAAGTVREAVLPVPPDVEKLLSLAQDAADESRFRAEQELQQHNASLVASRKASLTHSTQIKVDAASARLAQATEPRIIRLNEGRIRNLRGHLKAQLEDIESSHALVTSQQVAVLLIDR